MAFLLVLVFVVVPIVEILVIIEVGGMIGPWWTAGLLIADSLLGAWLLRREGGRAWRRFRDALDAGEWPGDAVAQGAMVLLGGALLLTPGFVTDAIGLALLLAPTRVALLAMLRRMLASRLGSPTSPTRPGSRTLGVEVVEIRRTDADGIIDKRRIGDDDGADRS
jgi:UPF0716 protein FxsA